MYLLFTKFVWCQKTKPSKFSCFRFHFACPLRRAARPWAGLELEHHCGSIHYAACWDLLAEKNIRQQITKNVNRESNTVWCKSRYFEKLENSTDETRLRSSGVHYHLRNTRHGYKVHWSSLAQQSSDSKKLSKEHCFFISKVSVKLCNKIMAYKLLDSMTVRSFATFVSPSLTNADSPSC